MKKNIIITLIIFFFLGIIFLDFSNNGVKVLQSVFSGIEIKKIEEKSWDYSIQTEGDMKILADRNIERSFESVKKLRMDIQNSKVKVNSSKDNKLRIKYIVKGDRGIKISNSKLKDIKIDLKENDENITLELKEADISGLKWDININLPNSWNLDINSHDSDFDIMGIDSNIKFKSVNGHSGIYDIDGEVDIEIEYGYIEIKRSKNVRIESNYATVRLNEIKEKVNLNSKYSDFSAKEIDGDAEFNSKFSDIWLHDINSKVKSEIEYGTFRYDNIENELDLKSKMSKISLEFKNSIENYKFKTKIEKTRMTVNENLASFEDQTGDIDIKLNINQGTLDIK